MAINWDELGPKLLKAIGTAKMEDCSACEGSGGNWDAVMQDWSKENACVSCGGCGRNFSGIWPPDLENALAAARDAGALE